MSFKKKMWGRNIQAALVNMHGRAQTECVRMATCF